MRERSIAKTGLGPQAQRKHAHKFKMKRRNGQAFSRVRTGELVMVMGMATANGSARLPSHEVRNARFFYSSNLHATPMKSSDRNHKFAKTDSGQTQHQLQTMVGVSRSARAVLTAHRPTVAARQENGNCLPFCDAILYQEGTILISRNDQFTKTGSGQI
jgi:hypothetical protein